MNSIEDKCLVKESYALLKPVEEASYQQDLFQRVALMALPFISLHASSGKIIALGSHAFVMITSLQSLSSAQTSESVIYLSCKVSLSIASIVFAVSGKSFALAMTTIGEMVLDVRQLCLAYQNEDLNAVADLSCSLFSSACYAGMLLTGLPEVILLALVTQALLELRSSHQEFQKGRDLEGYGHLALSLVRAFQAVPSARITYTKWMAPKIEKLKIVSFNILSDTTLGWFGEEVSKRPDDFSWDQRIERIHKGLQEINADVICLQEVEPKSYEYLKGRFGSGYESKLDLNDNKKFGVAIFVKKSSVDFQTVERCAYPGTTGRIAQIAELKLKKDGKEITVANTHLDQPTRDTQMGFLTEYLAIGRDNKDRVICGDFNARSSDDVGQVLDRAGYLHDDTAGFTNNHQNTELKRIDGIYHTSGITSSANAWKEIDLNTVLPNKEVASDHIPLIGGLKWRSVSQSLAENYRKTGLFFDHYWNWNRIKVEDF